MACVNPDGTLTRSALVILAALRTNVDAGPIAAATGLPIFRVRSALRELVGAELVVVATEGHRLTAEGERRLGEADRAA